MNTKRTKNAKRLLLVATSILFIVGSFNLYTANVVSVTSDIPAMIRPGSTIPVTVTITKGAVRGFGRFTSTLPKGFVATSTDPNFTFEDNTVTVLWVKLSRSNSFSFTYNIIVPEDSKTTFTYTGKFGYVQNNEKRFVEMKPKTVRVTNACSDPTPRISKNGSTSHRVNYAAVTCYRTINVIDEEAIVSVRVNKSNITAMSKIEEMIPDGYSAESLDNADAEFSSFANLARFMWVETPEQPTLTVSYKVKAEKGYKINDVYFNGAYTVYDGSENRSFLILDKGFQVDESTNATASINENYQLDIQKNATEGKFSQSQALDALADFQFTDSQADFFSNTSAINTLNADVIAQKETIASPEAPVEAIDVAVITEPIATPAKEDVAKIEVVKEVVKPVVEEKPILPERGITEEVVAKAETKVEAKPTVPQMPTRPTVALSNKNNTSQQATKLSETLNATNTDVTYSVQVAASRSQLSNQQSYFAKRNITDKVRMQRIDNWCKYTVNSFETYLNARNRRNNIWEETPIKGAFVVALKGNERITVQEALMLTNQKWVK